MDTAVIWAALITSFFAIVSSVGCLVYQHKLEQQKMHRALLEKYMSQLGELSYSLLSCLKIYPQTKTDTSRKRWQETLETTKIEINQIRLKLRYPLWHAQSLRFFWSLVYIRQFYCLRATCSPVSP